LPPPLSPFPSVGLRVVGPSRCPVCSHTMHPLRHFRATSASSPSPSRPRTRNQENQPLIPFQKRLASALWPYSIPRVKGPSLSTRSSPPVSRNGASVPKSHAPRVWLPSRRAFQPLTPWKPLSAPHALGLRPSELSSSQRIEGRFPFPSPLLRFLAKPHDFASALQRLHPP